MEAATMTASSIIADKGELVTIQRYTQTVDTSGVPIYTYATHLSNVEVFIQDSSGSESVRYGGESNRRFMKVLIVPGYDIQAKDRIVTSGSRTLDIQAVRTRGMSDPLQHMVADCEETL